MADTVRLRVAYRQLDSLAPYPNNARRHTVAQIEAIKRSLGEFGWTAPMLVADNQLIAGHARHRAASELAASGGAIPGVPDASQGPVIDLSHLPVAKRRAYVIADNRLAELAGWDIDLLRGEVLELDAGGFDTTLLGYSTPELSTLLAGWQTDYTSIDRTHPEATDQLGVIVVRCRKEQSEPIAERLRLALADDFDNATVTVRL